MPLWAFWEGIQSILKAVLSMPNTSTQHNSNYVVFSDSRKSLVTTPLLEVSERVPTGQRTASEQRENQLKRWQSGEKFFKRSWSGRKLFLNRSETGRGSQERTVSEPWENSKVKPERTPKNSTNRGRTMENECLQRSNTGVFRCVLCEGYKLYSLCLYNAVQSHREPLQRILKAEL